MSTHSNPDNISNSQSHNPNHTDSTNSQSHTLNSNYKTHHYTEVLIIGAGPAGLFAATTCSLYGLKAIIVEARSEAGGQCTALYPDKPIYDITSHTHHTLTGLSLIQSLLSQIQSFNIPLFLNTLITNITSTNHPVSSSDKTTTISEYSKTKTQNILQHTSHHAHTLDQHSSDINFEALSQHINTNTNFTENTSEQTHPITAHSTNAIFHAKYIILATGTGTLEPNKLILPSSSITNTASVSATNTKTTSTQDLESQGFIFYTLPSTQHISNKTLAILGGGDTALDYTLHLAHYAKHIYLIHRRPHFTAIPYTLQQLQHLPNVTILTSTSLQSIHHHDTLSNTLTLHISSTNNPHITTLQTNYILPCYGLKLSQTNTSLNPNLHTSHNKFTINPSTQLTSIPNIYAIGDASYHENKPKLFSILRSWHDSLNIFSN